MQKTLVICKPDSIQRKLVGEIIGRLEYKGLRIIAMKMLIMTPELLANLYSKHVTQAFYKAHEAFMLSGPVVAIVLEGPEAAAVVRRLTGATDCKEAAPGSIRGDLGISYRMNIIHSSDSAERAIEEIKILFDDSELIKYTNILAPWVSTADEEKL